MAHNGDSRFISIGARVDKIAEKKMKRISEDLGIPVCTLGAVCIYIGIRHIEITINKINNAMKHPIPQGLPKVLDLDRDVDSFFRPFASLFENDSIPPKLSKEIFVALQQKAREIENNKIQEEGIENE